MYGVTTGGAQGDGGRDGKGIHARPRALQEVDHAGPSDEQGEAHLDGSEHGEKNGAVIAVNELSYCCTTEDYTERISH